MRITFIDATTLPDLWFQAIYKILEDGKRFEIHRGSYVGQTRLEFDFFVGHVKFPGSGSGTPSILPEIPAACGLPSPVDFGYVYGGPGYSRSYIEYMMTDTKAPNESYTYGERLRKYPVVGDIILGFDWKSSDLVDNCQVDGEVLKVDENGNLFLDQIMWVIKTYKDFGYRNNQMVMNIAQPSDLLLKDPPCLRHIDTRIQDGMLHFHIYFRSWDLWGGLPANLAGLQALKEYMSEEIGVEDGEMTVSSKGLHLYGYAEKLAQMRCMKDMIDGK